MPAVLIIAPEGAMYHLNLFKMPNYTDFQSKLDVLNAIPNDAIQTPSLPVDIFLQEAENLYHWSLDDKDHMAVVGITEEQIHDLPVRAGALREAQSLWFKQRYSREEAQKLWSEKSPLAYALRDELLHAFRYAFRNEPALSSRVSKLSEGYSHSDMIQDLNDLAVLGRENSELLSTIGFNPDQLQQAAQQADEMADLLALTNGDREEHTEAKLIRDRAYTHLKELVSEIREAGKYLFWKDEQRLKGYSSNYWR